MGWGVQGVKLRSKDSVQVLSTPKVNHCYQPGLLAAQLTELTELISQLPLQLAAVSGGDGSEICFDYEGGQFLHITPLKNSHFLNMI